MMAKDIRRFKTYGQQSRREYERRGRERRIEERTCRLEALRTSEALDLAVDHVR